MTIAPATPIDSTPAAAAPSAPKARRSGILGRVGIGVFVAVLVGWTVVPLLWMLLGSFKSAADVTSPTPQVAFDPTFDNYRNLFSGANDLSPYLMHSVVAAVGSALIATVLGTLAGYGLARTKLTMKKSLSFWFISTRMAPIAAVVLPLFLMFRVAGLIDSMGGLILAYLSFNLPFAIWIMSSFFEAIPPSLEESAKVAGCTTWQTFWHVSLPLTRSGLVTTAVLCLVFSWNDYAFATIISGPHSQTLPIAGTQLVTQTGVDWGQLTAIGTIVVVPMMLAGVAVRRWLVTGLTLGAVTGE
ncbi:carbohydrate ABC transporter permease [Nocardioides sp. NPDC023903]|uniref:carbohydrate ABC transporter permease n=1 Tax=Nocardioides sp. NPDC023903 TaxID=3157195 RepID=UPI0033C71A38